MQMHRDAPMGSRMSPAMTRTAHGSPSLVTKRLSWVSARLSQRAGDGARADRHDQLPDGLRHNGRGARLSLVKFKSSLARTDDDRQPHRPAGAADARLLNEEIDQIDAYSPSTAHRGSTGLERSTCPFRRGGRPARDLHMGHLR